jgi:hypothetical protein
MYWNLDVPLDMASLQVLLSHKEPCQVKSQECIGVRLSLHLPILHHPSDNHVSKVRSGNNACALLEMWSQCSGSTGSHRETLLDSHHLQFWVQPVVWEEGPVLNCWLKSEINQQPRARYKPLPWCGQNAWRQQGLAQK